MSKAATSKALCYILRHGAEKEGIPISDDGYVLLSLLSPLKRFKSLSLQDYKDLVESDSKNRYSLQEVQNIPSGATALESWRIRANQGHSLASVSIPMHTIPIQEYPFVIHGTFPESMPDILATGLSRMTRQHIHFIPPGREELLRGGCSVCIVVDLNKAIADGIVFYRSDNGVVLTEGKEGRLDKMYFRRVEERDGESVIWTPDE